MFLGSIPTIISKKMRILSALVFRPGSYYTITPHTRHQTPHTHYQNIGRDPRIVFLILKKWAGRISFHFNDLLCPRLVIAQCTLHSILLDFKPCIITRFTTSPKCGVFLNSALILFYDSLAPGLLTWPFK